MKRIFAYLTPDRAPLIAFISFLIASPAYYLCRSKHFCMAGHLDHPEEFTPLARVTDGLWMFGFACAVVFAFRSDVAFRHVFPFALGVGYLAIADTNGVGSLLQVTTHIVLTVFLIACLFGWIE